MAIDKVRLEDTYDTSLKSITLTACFRGLPLQRNSCPHSCNISKTCTISAGSGGGLRGSSSLRLPNFQERNFDAILEKKFHEPERFVSLVHGLDEIFRQTLHAAKNICNDDVWCNKQELILIMWLSMQSWLSVIRYLLESRSSNYLRSQLCRKRKFDFQRCWMRTSEFICLTQRCTI